MTRLDCRTRWSEQCATARMIEGMAFAGGEEKVVMIPLADCRAINCGQACDLYEGAPHGREPAAQEAGSTIDAGV